MGVLLSEATVPLTLAHRPLGLRITLVATTVVAAVVSASVTVGLISQQRNRIRAQERDPCADAPFAWPCAGSIEGNQPAADPFTQFSRIMLVTAHPDDESIASGLVARLTSEGKQVVIVVCTNGDKGTANYSLPSPLLAEMRRQEMLNAVRALGATAVQLGYEDGNLDNSYEARLRVAAQIRLFRPELIVTFNPTYNFNHYQHGSEHKDHQTAGAIALDCFYPTARDHLQFAELWRPQEHLRTLARFAELDAWDKKAPLAGWKVREAYLMATERLSFRPPRYETVEIDVSAALETKARSLAMHVTQVGARRWQQLLPGIANHSATLGRYSRPPKAHAEWYTRVVNMP